MFVEWVNSSDWPMQTAELKTSGWSEPGSKGLVRSISLLEEPVVRRGRLFTREAGQRLEMLSEFGQIPSESRSQRIRIWSPDQTMQ